MYKNPDVPGRILMPSHREGAAFLTRHELAVMEGT